MQSKKELAIACILITTMLVIVMVLKPIITEAEMWNDVVPRKPRGALLSYTQKKLMWLCVILLM